MATQVGTINRVVGRLVKAGMVLYRNDHDVRCDREGRRCLLGSIVPGAVCRPHTSLGGVGPHFMCIKTEAQKQ